MIKHEERESHVKKSKELALRVPKLDSYVGPSRATKDAEVQMCAWAVENNKSATDIQEFAKLAKVVFADSVVSKNISLGRTKASAIVENVLGKSHHQELVEMMRNTCFSLLIDESTDIACKKALVMVVRIHSWDKEQLIIRDFFYQVLEMVEADATTIFNKIVEIFEKDQIPYKRNSVGFAADGANVMFGGKHSVVVLLKQVCPKLVLIKCVCHSFALCSSYACKHVPAYVEQLCRDIHNFLNNSPLRAAKFNELQDIMNLKPLKMLHPSATRWLSLEAVVNRMLERYEVLKVYFSFQDASVDGKQAEKMREIHEKLCNPLTMLYLNLLGYVIPKINKLNRMFQSENPKVYQLYSETERLVRTILDNFMRPEYMVNLKNVGDVVLEPKHYCELENMYMGVIVQNLLEEGVGKIPAEDIHAFKLAAMSLYISLVNQIKKRLSLDDEVLKNINLLDPKNVKRRIHLTGYNLFRHFMHLPSIENLQKMDDEFREILNLQWEKDVDFEDGARFWGRVLSMQRIDNSMAYPNLRTLIPVLLSLPHSSACVERIFSSYNINKTKARNKLITSSMQGILSAKEYVRTHKTASGVVNVSEAARRRFTKNMYAIND